MHLPGIRKIHEFLRLHPYELAAGGVILFAFLLRLYVIGSNWPPTDSDESMTGLTALHIAYYGEHPIFFFGETYMGAIEAYLAAAWFKFFGLSVFGMRIGVVAMFAVFLATLYAFTSRLYTRSFALLVLVILSLGSLELIFREIEAAGGYPETLCCAAAVFLVALLVHRTTMPRQKLVLYALWGIIAGIGLWSDMLILPWIAGSGVVLAWDWLRHRRRLAVGTLVLGLMIGAFPLVIWNITAPPSDGSFAVLAHQVFGGGVAPAARNSASLGQRLAGTVLVSIPVMTGGSALCSISVGGAWPLGANSSAQTITCTVEHGLWGFGVIALGVIAAWGEIVLLRRIRREAKQDDMVLPVTRLALLGSAALTLLSYALSPVPAVTPWASARYLTAMLVAFPALLWPLWRCCALPIRGYGAQIRAAFGFVSLWGILVVMLLGTVNTVHAIPGAAQRNVQQTQLITQLQQLHATRIYADYWTCNWVMFLTREQILCGVLNDQLHEGANRYLPSWNSVQAASHPAYVFPVGSPQIALMDQSHAVAHRIATDQYVIYLSS